MAERAELVTRHNAMVDEWKQIQARIDAGDGDRNGLHQRQANLSRGMSAIRAEVEQLDRQDRRQQVLALADDPANTLPTSGLPWRPGQREALPNPSTAQTSALRAIEANLRAGVLTPAAADRLDKLVAQDLRGVDAGYLAAVADSAYQRAFAQVLVHGPSAALRMEADEAEAMRRALRAEQVRASFDVGGGFSAAGAIGVGGDTLPLPLTADPTILSTSPGVEDPVSTDADVVNVSTSEYKMGTSAGMVASFGEEGSEVADSTPTVVPITIRPQRASAFGTFTVEAQLDWQSLQQNLTTMIQDSMAALEGEKFVSGAGEASFEPEGLLTGSTVIVTGSTAVLTVPDLEATQQALEPRYQPNAKWYGQLATRNAVDQLVAQADPKQAQIVDQQGNLLHRLFQETSNLPAPAPGAKVLVYGDLKQAYRIVRRIGLSIEIVPHLLGPNGRPNLTRGIIAYWRVSAAVVNPRAVRVYQLHA